MIVATPRPRSPTIRPQVPLNSTSLEVPTDLFRALGYHSALAVHGLDGLDEISICGPSRLRGFRGGSGGRPERQAD